MLSGGSVLRSSVVAGVRRGRGAGVNVVFGELAGSGGGGCIVRTISVWHTAITPLMIDLGELCLSVRGLQPLGPVLECWRGRMEDINERENRAGTPVSPLLGGSWLDLAWGDPG